MKFLNKNKKLLFTLLDSIEVKSIEKLVGTFKKVKNKRNNKIIFLGNGGSASICTHVSVDLSKNAGIKSMNFNEANFITCLSNDYGHENWMKEALRIHCNKNDLVVFVSSSGLEFALLSLNDCVAITLTSNRTAFPPLSPPRPNNSVSADELTMVEPPELESKSIKCVLPLS